MQIGRTVFAQVMEHFPTYEFQKCVTRYDGNFGKRSFSCLDQFLCLGFAQLTYRESLRDIEACLRSVQGKLYHMGFRGRISRSTLADANESVDWRIYADFAQVLIATARPMYSAESLGFDLDGTVYALDSTTIDLCLSVFPWARFQSTKGAVKMHTLLDLRGSIPTFIEVSDGKLHDVNILDGILPEAGSFYVMDRGYLDFERLYALHRYGAFFVTRTKACCPVAKALPRGPSTRPPACGPITPLYSSRRPRLRIIRTRFAASAFSTWSSVAGSSF